MKAYVKVCVSFHIACVDDILFLIMISSTLWDSYLKKIQSSLEISSSCEVFLLTSVLTLVYSDNLMIFCDQTSELFEGEFNL